MAIQNQFDFNLYLLIFKQQPNDDNELNPDPNCDHVRPEEDDDKSAAQKKLFLIMLICLSFMTVEIVFGIIAQSLAILTDAADLFSDSAGFIINIIAINYAKKKANS
jgi:Co/Zn/Cd efflux system component